MKNYLREYFKLLDFARSYRKTLVLAALCMGVSTIFEGASLGMIGPLTDRVFTNKEIVFPGNLPPFLITIIDKLNSIDALVFLKYMIIFMPILFLFKGIFLFLQDFLMNVTGQGVVRQVRNRIYEKFQDLPMEFYGRKRTGELMSRVTNDVAIITNSISYGLKDLIFESMKVVFFAFMAFWLGFQISWKLPLTIFIIFPLIMFPVARIGRRIKKFSKEIQSRMADLNSLMAETIQGAYIVKAFCREKYELDRFKDINQRYYKFTLKSAKRLLILSPLTEFVGVLGAVTIIWMIGREIVAGELSFGVFATFLVFLMSMIRPLKKLSNVHAINQQALAASARIYDILEEKSQVKEKVRSIKLEEFKNNISFNKVSFKYNESDDFVLRDINLKVKKGEVIALVGHSGVGKSTMVGLLPRFYDPQIGEVLIDGVKLKDLSLNGLRSLIAIVSQEMVLFNTTIRENIAYGKEDAGEEEVIDAARKAHALEFIEELPKGFDTIIGDRGFKLSGGQKQRLAIARAILKGAPILIFDEATSHLDSASEKLIQDALYNTLMAGKTAFIIAHRLATVQKADRIVVLESGRIVDIGTHDKLLASDTLYKKLHDLQFNS